MPGVCWFGVRAGKHFQVRCQPRPGPIPALLSHLDFLLFDGNDGRVRESARSCKECEPKMYVSKLTLHVVREAMRC